MSELPFPEPLSKSKGHGGKGDPERPSRTNRPSRGPKHGADPGWKPHSKGKKGAG